MSEPDEPRNPEETFEKKEVFRGHLDECLVHLTRCLDAHFPRGLKGAEKARQPIADFCGVDVTTVRGWLKNPDLPMGEKKIRLMCCLDLLGYQVLELERLKYRKGLAEIIGYGVLSTQQVAELLGYRQVRRVSNQSRGIFRLLLVCPDCSMVPDKEERLRNICKEKREELAQKKEEARAKCRLSFLLTDSVRQRKVSAAMNIMEGLLAMLESKEIGEPFAESLRDLPPPEKKTLLRLSDHLHSLSFKLACESQGEEDPDE